MKAAAQGFWSDEQGFIISAELVLILTIGVLGLIVGISSLQSALVFEMNNLAFAFSSLNQSYFVPGFFGCKGTYYGGSRFFSNFNNSCLFIGTTGGIGNGFVGGGGGFYASDFGVGGVSTGGTYVAPSTAPAVTPAPATTCPAGTTDAPCPLENCPTGNCPTGTSTGPAVNGPATESNSLKPVPSGPYPAPNVQ